MIGNDPFQFDEWKEEFVGCNGRSNMYTWSKSDVANAIDGVCSALDITVDAGLVEEYENGKCRDLLVYEKLRDHEPVADIPAVQKYLIGTKSFLDQPCQYYDIFRACRHVTFIQALSSALQSAARIENHEEKYAVLKSAKSYEEFEACLFELAVAHRYFSSESVARVRFVERGPSETPDLAVTIKGREYFVECKKYNRAADVSYTIRNQVRTKLRGVLDAFRKLRQGASLEISFHIHPQHIPQEKILDHCIESYRSHCPIIDADFTIQAKRLKSQEFPDFVLYPSPKYFWERYGFRDGREWFGLVHALIARYGYYETNIDSWEKLASTWLADVEWECAIKWKVTSEDIIARLRRLNYKRMFKGLSQLRACSEVCILHVWIERDKAIGHRQGEMLRFYDRIRTSGKDAFAWIIFDETCLDASPKGYFDMIEHAHFISGPTANGAEPLVSNVFTDPEGIEGVGAFGVGHDLPDIDVLHRE